jgi:co-chaperonin GroES (HSP10)
MLQQLESSGINLGERQAPNALPAHATLRPLRDHILVKPLEWNPSKVLAVVKRGRPLRGVVVAVGPGTRPWRYNRDRSKRWESKAFRPCDVKVGDTVELGGLEIDGYSLPQVMIGNEVHVIAREEDVAGIVNG